MTHNLALDVGGTNVRLALVAHDGADGGRQIATHTYDWATAGSVSGAITQFCERQDIPPFFDCLVVAFAGLSLPGQEQFTLTNTPQTFDLSELRAFASRVRVVNDFVAQAALVRQLGDGDQWVLKPGQANLAGAKAIVGPGTGLGVCAISAGGEIIPGEGGNTSLTHIPSQPDLHDRLKTLASSCPSSFPAPFPAPWRMEHILSGPGIERAYLALGGGSGGAEGLQAAQISQAAKAGDETARAALTCYFDALALCCADQTLQYVAAGGCYIMGHITNANLDLMDRARFVDIFTNASAHRAFLQDVPLILVTKTTSGLDGAAALIAMA